MVSLTLLCNDKFPSESLNELRRSDILVSLRFTNELSFSNTDKLRVTRRDAVVSPVLLFNDEFPSKKLDELKISGRVDLFLLECYEHRNAKSYYHFEM